MQACPVWSKSLWATHRVVKIAIHVHSAVYLLVSNNKEYNYGRLSVMVCACFLLTDPGEARSDP